LTRAIRVAAPAKLNLALAVTGTRPDGYHDLRSVFVTLDLADEVRVAPYRRLEVRVSVKVGPDDLATRAATALARATGREARAFIHVRKRIPLAAGLGGGSSDAGAVLRALAVLWRVDADLVKIAAAIGSDVPFFVTATAAALVRGRGEIVEPLPPPAEPLHVVLCRPPLRLATAEVYAAHRAEEIGAAPHVDALAEAFRNGRVDAATVRAHAYNDLLAAAARRCEAITTWRAAAADRGIVLHLTGSGPTLFAIADDRRDALRMARILRRAGLRARPHLAAVS